MAICAFRSGQYTTTRPREHSLEGLTASEVASGSGDILGGIFGEGNGMEVGGLLLEREERSFMTGSSTEYLEKFYTEVKR